MINGQKGREDELKEKTREVMMPDGNGGFELVTMDEATLSESYMDVGLSGKALQVSSVVPGFYGGLLSEGIVVDTVGAV